MGSCISKTPEETHNLVSNTDTDKYLYKYRVKLTRNFLRFRKNEFINLLLCENDLILENSKVRYGIIYNNIIEWGNYGYYFWTVSFMMNGDKKQYLLFGVNNSRDISKNLEEITSNIKRSYRDISNNS